MSLQDIKRQLQDRFSGYLSELSVTYGQEIRFSADADKLPEICGCLYHQMDMPLVDLFASDERSRGGKFALYYVFAHRTKGVFVLVKTLVDEKKPVFPSITGTIHAAHLYEREIRDLFGLQPEGHPDLRPLVFHGNWPQGVYPLRKDYDGSLRPPMENREQEFLHIHGTGVYEIPVGPVHAGIIEPGHFRFSVAGEPVINLEAQLYFVHKGIEKMCEGAGIEKCFYISERISGDETFANSLAYCQAVEKIAGVEVPERAQYSRVVFAELERLISHLGDLNAVCTDVAYGFAASQFGMMRIWAYQMTDQICSSRFLRSVNSIGGVRRDFLAGWEKKLQEFLFRLYKELTDTIGIIKSSSLFIDRVEHTGVLDLQTAIDLNAVGPAGRAAGVHRDMRKDFPYAAYGKLDFAVPDHNNGDVNCRINVKLEECFEAIKLIRQALEAMPQGGVHIPVDKAPPYRSALGYTEAPRGENIHWVMSGEDNTVFRYKIRTPSFCNWPALCHAVKGNVVPDFPLINKSFNLSYAGNDL